MKAYTLITGGCSGIGLSTAHKFASEGHSLILVSERRDRLENALKDISGRYPEIDVQMMMVDLSDADGPEKIFNHIKENNLNIDVLVNNAGYGIQGTYDTTDVGNELKMIQLNVISLYHLSRLFLNHMEKNGRGHIINLSSIAAFSPGPKLAAYCATKSFVHHYSRALNYELERLDSSIRVSTICPPAVVTDFAKRAGMEGSKLYEGWLVVQVEEVAEAIWKAYVEKKDVIVPRYYIHLIAKIYRRLPTRLKMWMGWRETA